MATKIYVMLLYGYNPLTYNVDRVCLSSHAYASQPLDTPANTDFLPVITNPGTFSQAMYAQGTTGGNSTGGIGIIELTNVNGVLDYLTKWGFYGNPCIIKEGYYGQSLADFGTILSGTVEQLEFSWNKITVRYRDRVADLDKPIALNFYLGNNSLPSGFEGLTELKGKPKPRLFGSCFNINPVIINTSALLYQFNDGSSSSITAVRDSGVPITVGNSYATKDLLRVAATSLGTYDYCLADSMIKLGSMPVGEVTMDVVASTSSIGQTIKSLVIQMLDSTVIAEQTIIDLDKSIPSSKVWGFYTGLTEMTVKSVLDDLASIGIWWGFDNSSMFWAKQFTTAIDTNPIITITADEALTIERVATNDTTMGVPVWKVICRYKKNYMIQTTVAGSVLPGVYDKEWLEAQYSDQSIKVINPKAEILTIDTVFKNEADALAEATRQFTMRSVRRDRLKISVSPQACRYSNTGYWDDEAISDIPYNKYSGGCCVMGGTITGNDYLDMTNKAHMYAVANNLISSTKVYRLNMFLPSSSWEAVTDMPSARGGGDMITHDYPYVVVSSPIPWRAIFFVGGYNSGGVSQTNVWYLGVDISGDIRTTWNSHGTFPALPTGRSYCKLATYGTWLFVLGGEDSGGNTVIKLDTTAFTNTWQNVVSLPSGENVEGVVVRGNFMYVWCYKPSTHVSNVYMMDLTSQVSWDSTTIPDLPAGRNQGSTFIHGSKWYIVSGMTWNGSSLISATSVIMLDLDNLYLGWQTMAPLPLTSIMGCAAEFRGKAYVVGGYTGSVYKSSTYRYRNNDVPDDVSQLYSLGRTALVKIPRYDYTAGKPMKIIGVESDHKKRIITLDLWG